VYFTRHFARRLRTGGCLLRTPVQQLQERLNHIHRVFVWRCAGAPLLALVVSWTLLCRLRQHNRI